MLLASVTGVRAGGGAADSSWTMQFQRGVRGVPVVVPEERDSTGPGAAVLPGAGAGMHTLDRARGWERSAGGAGRRGDRRKS